MDKPNYNYKAKNNLLLYFDDPIRSFNKVHICAYKVTADSKYPFLNFLLCKQKFNDTLQLPEIPIFKDFDNAEVVNYSKICLFGLCMLTTDFDTFAEKIMFNGFYKFQNNLYLFFDVTNCSIKLNDIYSNSPLWFGIIDELVNHKKICNLSIEKEVSELFVMNDDFCFLQDENNVSYEIPIVGFIGTTKQQVTFKYVFGESIRNKNSILGPYFYFTNFENSFEKRVDKSDKIERSECIVRFALFVGNVKYIENLQCDPIDESEIKKERLQDTSLDQNMEKLTMRISDHDGLWSKTYDSAYIGKFELDNGEHLKDVPMIVTSLYEQQTPLSFHYTSKSTFPKDYLIL